MASVARNKFDRINRNEAFQQERTECTHGGINVFPMKSSSAKQTRRSLFFWQVFLSDLCVDLCVFARKFPGLVAALPLCATPRPSAINLLPIQKRTAEDAEARRGSKRSRSTTHQYLTTLHGEGKDCI